MPKSSSRLSQSPDKKKSSTGEDIEQKSPKENLEKQLNVSVKSMFLVILLCIQRNFKMVYNVKRFKQIMESQAERRAFMQIPPGGAENAAIQGKKLSMDFANIVKTIDLANDDSTIAEMNKQADKA